MLRALAAASLCLAGVAQAEESGAAGVVVHPVLGLGLAVCDGGGFGPTAQVGLRVAPVLVRLSLDADVWARSRERAFLRLAGHADLLVLERSAWAAFVGGHYGGMGYGPGIGDDPATSWVAGPELGLLLGPGRALGRILVTAELLLSDGPRSPPSHPSERATPPVVVVSLVASL